jgi:hypothetical protein
LTRQVQSGRIPAWFSGRGLAPRGPFLEQSQKNYSPGLACPRACGCSGARRRGIQTDRQRMAGPGIRCAPPGEDVVSFGGVYPRRPARLMGHRSGRLRREDSFLAPIVSEQTYPPQAPAGYDHRDLALFDIVGPTPIFRLTRPAAPGRASARPGGHDSQ